MPHLPLSRSHAVLLALGLLAVLAVGGRRLADAGSARTSAPPPRATLTPLSPATPVRLVVHVAGAVRRPGVYRFEDGARVADAVARAGGAVHGSDLSALNLAAPLADGTQVLVPRQVDPAAAAASTAPADGGAQGGKVHLSTASVEQLDTLPGVGPVTAQKIVDWRTAHGPFRTIDDLDAIPGIGPARLEQLRDLAEP